MESLDRGEGAVGEPVLQSLDPNGTVWQVPVMVNISRKGMLQQITSKIGAVIRTEGIIKLDDNKRVAWLTIESPPKDGGGGLVEVETFQGIPCMTDCEAEENVSELVIGHFLSRQGICVNDINYSPFLETCRQLHYCMCWSHALQTRCETLRMEREAMINAYMDLLNRLISTCVRFNDILPLSPPNPPLHPMSVPIEPLLYTGSMPPHTRLELLAQELFSILKGNTPAGNPMTN